MHDLFFGNGIAHTILLLAFVIGGGLYLGRFKVKGISLGSTWVLFLGILMGHLGFGGDPDALHFVKEFGLILFVFSIGLQGRLGRRGQFGPRGRGGLGEAGIGLCRGIPDRRDWRHLRHRAVQGHLQD